MRLLPHFACLHSTLPSLTSPTAVDWVGRVTGRICVTLATSLGLCAVMTANAIAQVPRNESCGEPLPPEPLRIGPNVLRMGSSDGSGSSIEIIEVDETIDLSEPVVGSGVDIQQSDEVSRDILEPSKSTLKLAAGQLDIEPPFTDDEVAFLRFASSTAVQSSPLFYLLSTALGIEQHGTTASDEPSLAAIEPGEDVALVVPPAEPEMLSPRQKSLVEKGEAAGTNSKDAGNKSIAKTVRKPFENNNDGDEPKETASVPERIPERIVTKSAKQDMADYLQQEEPSASQVKEFASSPQKDLEGVDAKSAAKPGQHRKEVVIEDVTKPNSTTNNSVPIAKPAPTKREIADPALAKRMARAQACLDHYLNNPESTVVRSPWAVMHAVLAYGSEYEMVTANGGRVNAIGWMCHNGLCRTQRMFTPNGRTFKPNVGGGVQGHEGQFLAILAQSSVPLDYPIQIGDRKFTVEDLVRYEMATCKEKSELTFKLIGLSYYLDTNKQWKTNDGKVWSIPKLIQEELDQPIVGSACGGTHRLMGFSFAIKQRLAQGQPLTGQYARASKFVDEYVNYTWQLQNPDGSFSTNWYEGRGNEANEERKVQTSGHMLEWLLYTIPAKDVSQPRVQKAVDFLLAHIYDKRDHKWPIGPRGHATRAIALYHARMSEEAAATPTITAPSQGTVNTVPSKVVSPSKSAVRPNAPRK